MGTSQGAIPKCDNCRHCLTDARFALRLSGFVPPSSKPILGVSERDTAFHTFCDLACLQSWALARQDTP